MFFEAVVTQQLGTVKINPNHLLFSCLDSDLSVVSATPADIIWSTAYLYTVLEEEKRTYYFRDVVSLNNKTKIFIYSCQNQRNCSGVFILSQSCMCIALPWDPFQIKPPPCVSPVGCFQRETTTVGGLCISSGLTYIEHVLDYMPCEESLTCALWILCQELEDWATTNENLYIEIYIGWLQILYIELKLSEQWRPRSVWRML